MNKDPKLSLAYFSAFVKISQIDIPKKSQNDQFKIRNKIVIYTDYKTMPGDTMQTNDYKIKLSVASFLSYNNLNNYILLLHQTIFIALHFKHRLLTIFYVKKTNLHIIFCFVICSRIKDFLLTALW